eukprot:gene15183-20123_t
MKPTQTILMRSDSSCERGSRDPPPTLLLGQVRVYRTAPADAPPQPFEQTQVHSTLSGQSNGGWCLATDVSNQGGTLAKRFAAKEAFSKAVGTGFKLGVFMKDIGVVNAPSGAPTLALAGGAK